MSYALFPAVSDSGVAGTGFTSFAASGFFTSWPPSQVVAATMLTKTRSAASWSGECRIGIG
jgi:hypothetical protein